MAITVPTLQPTTIVTGLDIVVLVLLLHVWLLVVGLAAWNDDARTGVRWIDRRIHMSTRLYGTMMLLAVLAVWAPFAVGQYPIGPTNPFGHSRTAFGTVVIAGLLVGTGFYFLGGVVTNLRSYVAFRRSRPTSAGAVTSGPVQVSGTVVPLEKPLEAPVTGAEVIWYRLSATRVADDDDERLQEASDYQFGSTPAGDTTLDSVLVDQTTRLEERRRLFAVRDDTGRVAVDPSAAELRLERTASEPVPGDSTPSEPLATHLLETNELELSDRNRIYHEEALRPGEEVTVVGVATEPNDAAGDDEPTITAGETGTEFVVASGCAETTERHFRRTIVSCSVAAVVASSVGLSMLSWLAGHGWWITGP
ncbi:GIDE domain-containing protein [Natronolimnohabitans sp. A-GB9]|uniref:GIDE domain-containing protein n=1 Tax=Natronolimnohabitans sp. A-GB9 TaxID=3069757 RepID=UPI0027AE62F9|nr:GIDE domain-containing protein [Natronolimnohabitans sp. A-GB9]MDQ2051928.1 GIDE domain-containing protein [Natronolimnohabitans sp. A-GB9]